MTTSTLSSAPDLEAMALDLATVSKCSLPEARAAIRMEMARMGVSLGWLSVEKANAFLAPLGVVLSVLS